MIKRPFAFFPSLSVVLIAEPGENKIGIYDAKTLNFHSWMLNPDVRYGTKFVRPNYFLILKSGTVFLLEENKINILDVNFVPSQKPLSGSFLKLVEGESGTVWIQNKDTLSYMKLELDGDFYCLKTDDFKS